MKKSIYFYIVAPLLVLFLSESLLRILKFQPGVLMPPKEIREMALNFSDTLYVLEAFIPDSLGVMKYNPTYDTSSFDTDFSQFLPELRMRIKKHILNVPINSDGFQDDEFTSKDTLGKKKVLLLGDSFTWGYSADPIANSFSNLLGKEEGFVTYNLGVPGSDLATYLKLSEVYTPIIKPDFVIINFYVSNDFLYYRKILKKFKYSDIYPTNVGAFLSMNYETIGKDSIEVFDSYTDAYNHAAQKYTWKGETNYVLQHTLKYSALIAQIVRIVYGYYEPHVNSTFLPAEDCTREYLLRTDSICNSNGAVLLLAVINNGNSDNTAEIEECKKHFGNFPFYMPDNIRKPDDFFPSPDGHFNNTGHKKYEQFLLDILEGLATKR